MALKIIVTFLSYLSQKLTNTHMHMRGMLKSSWLHQEVSAPKNVWLFGQIIRDWIVTKLFQRLSVQYGYIRALSLFLDIYHTNLVIFPHVYYRNYMCIIRTHICQGIISFLEFCMNLMFIQHLLDSRVFFVSNEIFLRLNSLLNFSSVTTPQINFFQLLKPAIFVLFCTIASVLCL